MKAILQVQDGASGCGLEDQDTFRLRRPQKRGRRQPSAVTDPVRTDSPSAEEEELHGTSPSSREASWSSTRLRGSCLHSCFEATAPLIWRYVMPPGPVPLNGKVLQQTMMEPEELKETETRTWFLKVIQDVSHHLRDRKHQRRPPQL